MKKILPIVQRVLDNPGVWLCGDTRQPGAIVIAVSMDGKIYPVEMDDPLSPEGFYETGTFFGPFTKPYITTDLIRVKPLEWHATDSFSEGSGNFMVMKIGGSFYAYLDGEIIGKGESRDEAVDACNARNRALVLEQLDHDEAP